MTPTLEQRCESWDNYCNLFGVILHGNVNMQLPNLWLWEMVDEFIYQFQSFCQYRGKLSVKTKEELALLKDCDQVWNVVGVLNYLQALVDKSDICAVLEKERAGLDNFSEKEGYDYNSSNVLRTLGYFSLIGLHRIHVLLGDYTTALKVLDPIDLDKPGIFTKVAGASVSTAYHVGFSYFMCKAGVGGSSAAAAACPLSTRTLTPPTVIHMKPKPPPLPPSLDTVSQRRLSKTTNVWLEPYRARVLVHPRSSASFVESE